MISDSRTHFKTHTFSNFKKSKVIKELENCIHYQKKEEAFYWTGELICSGHILELWNLFLYVLCKYIHINNPRLPLYVDKKFTEFKELSNQLKNDLDVRNQEEVRTLLFSIVLLLCESKRDMILEDLHFTFKFENIFTNLKAPHVDYIKPYFKEGDPKEIYIPLNECAYHLIETRNRMDIFYWIDWMIQYDEQCIKNKKTLLCVSREFAPVKSNNIIWILFELFLSFQEPDILYKIIHSLMKLFSIKYTPSTNKKRKHILNLCVLLIIHDAVDFKTKIIENTSVFIPIQENINMIFEQIKKNEIHDD
jgi:ssDNA-specific exonuclease RecJ